MGSLNIKVSEAAIKFLKTQPTICTAGQIKDQTSKFDGKWLGAIIHGTTHKLVISTPPVFKKKMDAILFMEDLKLKAQREILVPNRIIHLN